METIINNETATDTKATTSAEPKATREAAGPPRRAPVAPAKGKAGKKAKATKKASQSAPKAKGAKKPAAAAKAAGARDGSKTAHILDLLKRPGGATTKELMEATGWQPHSVRGFLSGTARKKLGLAVISTKGEDGERSYSIEA